jgi:pyridoxamine 5'-phosphate oxidase
MLDRVLERMLSIAGGLSEPLPGEPMALLRAWFDEAVLAARQPNPTAMSLATSTRDGRPSARIVLCRGIDPASASLTFFTNYASRKGDDLAANPRAAAVFHWDPQNRQARVEGVARRLPDAESDAYFRSRPLLKRLGAWASDQSRPLPSRAALLARLAEAMERFEVSAADLLDTRSAIDVPRPPHWGGYRLDLDAVELWCGGDGRLHDRARWDREGPAWHVTRLFP